MAIKFSCPHCSKSYSVPDEVGGRTVRCSGCKGEMEVPLPSLNVLPPPVPVMRPAPPPDSPPSDTKPCPFCAELIEAEATKCRYCGEILDRALRAELKATLLETEITGRLDRLIIATEKAADRLFWIALPIYLSVAVFALWFGMVILLGILSAR